MTNDNEPDNIVKFKQKYITTENDDIAIAISIYKNLVSIDIEGNIVVLEQEDALQMALALAGAVKAIQERDNKDN